MQMKWPRLGSWNAQSRRNQFYLHIRPEMCQINLLQFLRQLNLTFYMFAIENLASNYHRYARLTSKINFPCRRAQIGPALNAHSKLRARKQLKRRQFAILICIRRFTLSFWTLFPPSSAWWLNFTCVDCVSRKQKNLGKRLLSRTKGQRLIRHSLHCSSFKCVSASFFAHPLLTWEFAFL
jgi:hypothetical protein